MRFLMAAGPLLMGVRHPSTVMCAAHGDHTVSISSAFNSGNVKLTEMCGQTVRLAIQPDPHTELEKRDHKQWFAFRSTLVADASVPAASVTYEIVNAGSCSYASAWKGYEVCVSHDQQRWRRVASTCYDAERGILQWEWRHALEQRIVYFAYFDVYPYERHLQLVAQCRAAVGPGLQVASLGDSLDGRPIDVITVGTGPLHAWVVHRQHPGEPQASFFAEGLLDRLLGLSDDAQSAADALPAAMLAAFTWHVVPAMNPDGVCRGHLRTNAAGANLNREWAVRRTRPLSTFSCDVLARACVLAVAHSDTTCCTLMAPHWCLPWLRADSRPARLVCAATVAPRPEPRQSTPLELMYPGGTGMYDAPTVKRSPEVCHVLAAMDATGVDLFVDVHGDEAIPYGFAAGNEGGSNWGPRLEALHGAFVGAFARANADMQARWGYTPDPPLWANPAVSADQVAQRFDCLAVTLEMPFKDVASRPAPKVEDAAGNLVRDEGFDGKRCAMIGASLLDAAEYGAVSPLPSNPHLLARASGVSGDAFAPRAAQPMLLFGTFPCSPMLHVSARPANPFHSTSSTERFIQPHPRPLCAVHGSLRGVPEPRFDLTDDAYLRPTELS